MPKHRLVNVGRTKFIQCNLTAKHQSIFWYSADRAELHAGVINGEIQNGYKSGHLNILADGTFVIYNTDIDDLGLCHVDVTNSGDVVPEGTIETHDITCK